MFTVYTISLHLPVNKKIILFCTNQDTRPAPTITSLTLFCCQSQFWKLNVFFQTFNTYLILMRLSYHHTEFMFLPAASSFSTSSEWIRRSLWHIFECNFVTSLVWMRYMLNSRIPVRNNIYHGIGTQLLLSVCERLGNSWKNAKEKALLSFSYATPHVFMNEHTHWTPTHALHVHGQT